jgi:predicted acyl esterase
VLLGAAVVLAAAVAVVIHARSSSSGPRAARTVSITAADGARLVAEVISPSGGGPFPLLVMPASWGAPASEYNNLAAKFALAGYQVVAYAERGFQGSGGSVDFGGPATQHDVSSVIDWALEHTHADAAHIGLFGISLGAGMSLFAAAHDRRVKAVVATSTWTDLASALAPHGTLNRSGLAGLFANPRVVAALDPQVRRLDADLRTRPQQAISLLTQMSKTRSVDRAIDALDRNQPAIMIANAYQDSLFDPNSVVQFFDRLHTPKRLQLATGDHGGPEWPALYGKKDATINMAVKWLDHYLKGVDNGIESAEPVSFEDGTDGTVRTYKQLPVTGRTFRLGAPGRSGDMSSRASAPWSRSVTTGTDSGADAGGTSNLVAGTYDPATISIDSLNAAHAFIWSTRPLARTTVLSGLPTFRAQLRSATHGVSLYAYLYDVDPSGVGTLLTYAPATASTGRLSVTMRPMSWTVQDGDYLAFAVDTVDPRFASTEPVGSTLTLSSPAELSVPSQR